MVWAPTAAADNGVTLTALGWSRAALAHVLLLHSANFHKQSDGDKSAPWEIWASVFIVSCLTNSIWVISCAPFDKSSGCVHFNCIHLCVFIPLKNTDLIQ